MTAYRYTILSDGLFPNKAVNVAKFTEEIRAETAILTALDSVTIDTGDCVVTMRAALSMDEVLALEALVFAHDGIATPPVTDDAGRPMVALPPSSFGLPVVAVRDAPDEASDYVKAWQLNVPASTTKFLDIIISDDIVGPLGYCFLIGGEYRSRTNAVEGCALQLAIVDRDDVLGIFPYYGLSRTKISGLTNVVGTISPGDLAWGQTSGRHSKVLSVVSGSVLEVTYHDGPLEDGEELVFKHADGSLTGATATLGTWDEGDVIEIKRFVKDEWVEGYDTRTIKAGGSKQLPNGLYIRVVGYNASLTDVWRVKFSFQLATK